MPIPCMLCAVLLICAVTSSAVAATCPAWPATVYLLRHAEKMTGSSDPPLNPDGWQRAGDLPAALAGVKVGAIFVSDQQRTGQTAMSLAAATGITPVAFKHKDINGLVRAICTAGANSGLAVVVVGHTTTIPTVMAEIGVPTSAIPAISDTDFGDLFVVDTDAHALKTARYGDCR